MTNRHEVLRRADGVVICVVPGSDPVLRQVADLCYETLHRPFGCARNDAWNEMDPASTHFVALEEEQLVGYVRLIAEHGGGHVRQVTVAPSHRRRGIANDLVSAALDRARELRLPFAFLNARANAVGLYRRLGFSVTSGPSRMGRTYLAHVRMEMPLR
jgi:ribosomal protein S18 acetylase RimI-like enzyme